MKYIKVIFVLVILITISACSQTRKEEVLDTNPILIYPDEFVLKMEDENGNIFEEYVSKDNTKYYLRNINDDIVTELAIDGKDAVFVAYSQKEENTGVMWTKAETQEDLKDIKVSEMNRIYLNELSNAFDFKKTDEDNEYIYYQAKILDVSHDQNIEMQSDIYPVEAGNKQYRLLENKYSTGVTETKNITQNLKENKIDFKIEDGKIFLYGEEVKPKTVIHYTNDELKYLDVDIAVTKEGALKWFKVSSKIGPYQIYTLDDSISAAESEEKIVGKITELESIKEAERKLDDFKEKVLLYNLMASFN
jgi:hypothetical protein